MPKVNDEYINKKKLEILDAAFKVFQDKPLYEITMLDVIKEAGLSKGGIYRYFSDVDEVIIALINRETAKNDYRPKIDEILTCSSGAETIIAALFSFLAKYINESPILLGKFQFELTVYLANHPEKEEKFKNNLKEQENGQYLIEALFNKIREGISNGELKEMFPLESIFTYTITAIDGVVNKVVLEKCYGSRFNIDVIKIFEIISNSVLHMLGTK